MKKIVFSLFACAVSLATSNDSIESFQSQEHHAPLLPWADDLNAGLVKAKSEKLPVYIYFTGSEWCIWCKKMDRELHNTDIFRQKTIGQFVFVRIELPAGTQPNDNVKKIIETYHVNGVPTAIILSSSGTEIARFRYQQIKPEEYVELIMQAIKNDAKEQKKQ